MASQKIKDWMTAQYAPMLNNTSSEVVAAFERFLSCSDDFVLKTPFIRFILRGQSVDSLKMGKGLARYGEPKSKSTSCFNCIHSFRAFKDRYRTGCNLVKGGINPQMSCKLWEARKIIIGSEERGHDKGTGKNSVKVGAHSHKSTTFQKT